MRRTKRLVTGVVALGALVLGGAPDPARGEAHGDGAASGNAATVWNQIAVRTLTGLPGPAGGAPPAAQVHVAMVQAAVYDAVAAIGPARYEPYLLAQRFPADASPAAAVASAAYGVLSHLVSTVPVLPEADRATLLDALDAQYATALSDVRRGPSQRRGVRAGRAAAAAMVADRQDDGRFGPSPWVPDPAPGHWSPQTDPQSGQPLLDPTPWVGEVDPFVLETPSQFRTAGPLPPPSAAWARQLRRVQAVGALNSTVRTPAQTYVARWWQSTPVASWNEVARDLAVRNGLGLTRTARLLALQNVAGADASINCWNDKYHYDFWRPWNAIPRAAEDGNPATEPEAGWSPLIAAPYPEHPSGHLCQDGAHTSVLRRAFGDTVAGGYRITSGSALLSPTDPRERVFGSFSQALDEVNKARVWAGLHVRAADVQGERLGRQVAAYVRANAFQPVGDGR